MMGLKLKTSNVATDAGAAVHVVDTILKHDIVVLVQRKK
jgi:hypothetical protein